MRSGFILVELSIVLVILGLLVGGILAGQSLIRAAELRSVTTEYNKYLTASMTFRDRYFALPGDMTNATAVWGTAGTCPGTSASPSTTPATCNGDGNGLIQRTATNSNEVFRYWQQLASAGLIEGTYTGVANNVTANANDTNIGVNIPASKLSKGGWTAYSLGSAPISDTTYFEGDYSNLFFFGGSAGNDVSFLALLKPEEVWNIDTKMDDSKPATGAIRTLESQGGTCSDIAASNSLSRTASVYKLDTSTAACSFIMKM